MTTNNRKKKYTVTFHLNGEKFIKKQNSVDDAIMKVKPDFLHTEMYVSVKKGKDVMDRHLNLLEGRKLFANETFREIFINNLMLT